MQIGMLWHLLRMARWKPPGLADDGSHRADLFRAAMQQFEELMAAAASTGPASSPLLVYYALNQAGRAILAVREQNDDEVFATAEGHGLTVKRDSVGPDLLSVTIKPKMARTGHFQRVAHATSSPVLQDPGTVTLGALLASLPELADSWGDDRWPGTAGVYPLMDLAPRRSVVSVMDAQLFLQGVARVAVLSDVVQSPEDIARLEEFYPSIRGRNAQLPIAGADNLPGRVEFPTPAGVGFELRLSVPAGSKAPVADYDALLDAIAPEYRWLGRRWLRPELQPGTPPPSALMTWWVVLYALSMLARYYPRAWTAALSVDHSPIAALLERTLSVSLEAVPHLVYAEVLAIPAGSRPLLPPGALTPPAQA